MNADTPPSTDTSAAPEAPDVAPLRALLQAVRRTFRAGDYDRAEVFARRILEMRPNHPYPIQMLGIIANERDDLGAAVNLLRRARALRPGNPLTRLNLGLVALKMGQFRQGWLDYEFRFSLVRERDRQHVQLPELPFPRWTGEPLDGKRLLLVREQGFGDQIQFIRYATRLRDMGATVGFLTRPPLLRLMQTAAGVGEVFVDPLPEGQVWDYWCPVMSIAGVLGTDLSSIPGGIPYLSAEPDESERWETVLAAHAQGRPRVGLAWTGNVGHVRNTARSVTFAAVDALARAHPEIAFVSLQIGKHEKAAVEAAAPDCPILFLGREDGADFAEAAAVVSRLDLVIGIDTSSPHLAGALGVPAWLLLHRGCDWRWLRFRADSPWYPSHRLFRQVRRDDWDTVLTAVSRELGVWAANRDRE